MKPTNHSVSYSRWEVLFQVVLFLIVFLFYSFDRRNPGIQEVQVVFFLNFVLAVLIINYVLLPRFFYKKRYMIFFLYFSMIVALTIIIEELVLEKIYYPDSRGQRFPGVVFSLLDVLPVITILSGFKFAWDIITKQQEVERLRELMEESELRFLKSQLNPHFLFNNLNNLYSYALENSPKTPKIILEMASVLRYMLYECKEKYVPLKNELKQLGNFVKLNELQVEERGDIKFSAPEAGLNDYKIAPLILMVFVENAFKHSIGSQAEDISINIEIDLSKDGQLTFKCDNSFSAENNSESLTKGIGLENVKKRLELLYPGAYNLKIHSDKDFFKVQLTLDLT
ncbi:MAG: histidine kinase [Cyclobacteriaceae bacterium]